MKKLIQVLLPFLFMSPTILIVCSIVGVLTSQVIGYFKTGYWESRSIARLLGWNNPTDWYGLWEILEMLHPIFLAPLLIPSVLLVFSFMLWASSKGLFKDE